MLGVVHNLRWPKFTSFLPPTPSSWHVLTLAILPPNVNVDIRKMTPYRIDNFFCKKVPKFNRIMLFPLYQSNINGFLLWGTSYFGAHFCQRWHWTDPLPPSVDISLTLGYPPTPSSCQRELWTTPYRKLKFNHSFIL